MSTTAQEVFDLAMGLMDEISSGGASDTSENVGYKNKTLRILNTLQQELYPLSDTYTVATAGTRPVCAKLTALTDTIGLDDYLSQTVLPYGLAAVFYLDENPNVASFFQQRYEELKTASKIPNEFTPIENVYGGQCFNEYSRW